MNKIQKRLRLEVVVRACLKCKNETCCAVQDRKNWTLKKHLEYDRKYLGEEDKSVAFQQGYYDCFKGETL